MTTIFLGVIKKIRGHQQTTDERLKITLFIIEIKENGPRFRSLRLEGRQLNFDLCPSSSLSKTFRTLETSSKTLAKKSKVSRSSFLCEINF